MQLVDYGCQRLRPRSRPQSIFDNIYRGIDIQKVINLNMWHAPED